MIDVGVSSNKQPNIDDIYVTAVVYVASREALPAATESAAKRIKTRADGSIAVTLGSFTIETNDSEARQEQLAEVLASLWGTFVNAGFATTSEVCEPGVIISISLTPQNGQAGIAIAPASLRPWLGVNAELHVNAYPND
jgi:hypothetical protein